MSLSEANFTLEILFSYIFLSFIFFNSIFPCSSVPSAATKYLLKAREFVDKCRCQWCKRLWVELWHSVQHNCGYSALTRFIRSDISNPYWRNSKLLCSSCAKADLFLEFTDRKWLWDFGAFFVELWREHCFKASWAGQQIRPQSERRCFISIRICLCFSSRRNGQRSRIKSVVKGSCWIGIRNADIFFSPHFWCHPMKFSYWFIASHKIWLLFCTELFVAENRTSLLLLFRCWVIIGLGSWLCCWWTLLFFFSEWIRPGSSTQSTLLRWVQHV